MENNIIKKRIDTDKGMKKMKIENKKLFEDISDVDYEQNGNEEWIWFKLHEGEFLLKIQKQESKYEISIEHMNADKKGCPLCKWKIGTCDVLETRYLDLIEYLTTKSEVRFRIMHLKRILMEINS